MTTIKVQDVRDVALKTLNELGFADAKPAGENLFIRDRYFVGCRFRFDGVSTIWLEEGHLLWFVDDAGKLLKVVRLRPNACAVSEQAE